MKHVSTMQKNKVVLTYAIVSGLKFNLGIVIENSILELVYRKAISHQSLIIELCLRARCVDPTRSTDRRDSLLNGRKCEKKMWVDFRVLENPSPRRNGFALESPLTFIFIFKWGKPSKNKKPQ